MELGRENFSFFLSESAKFLDFFFAIKKFYTALNVETARIMPPCLECTVIDQADQAIGTLDWCPSGPIGPWWHSLRGEGNGTARCQAVKLQRPSAILQARWAAAPSSVPSTLSPLPRDQD